MENVKKVLDTIAHHLGDPVALAVAVALGAIAVSGKFSVRATQLLLLIAWLLVLLALREQTWMLFCVNAVASAVAFVLLAIFFRPETIPQNFGALIPGRKLLFSKNKNPAVEIGDGGAVLVWGGAKGEAMLRFAEDSDLVIEMIRGKVYVSTQIKDATGNVLVELVRNKWRVAPSPATWDRNYSKNALEVKDPTGKIVLQVKTLPDRVQLQGEWKNKNGRAIRFVKSPDGNGGILVIRPDRVFLESDPKIEPIFEYPGDANLGRLRAA
jgi:hypothetical protein